MSAYKPTQATYEKDVLRLREFMDSTGMEPDVDEPLALTDDEDEEMERRYHYCDKKRTFVFVERGPRTPEDGEADEVDAPDAPAPDAPAPDEEAEEVEAEEEEAVEAVEAVDVTTKKNQTTKKGEPKQKKPKEEKQKKPKEDEEPKETKQKKEQTKQTKQKKQAKEQKKADDLGTVMALLDQSEIERAKEVLAAFIEKHGVTPVKKTRRMKISTADGDAVDGDAPEKKKRGPTGYNKFFAKTLARLREEEPDLPPGEYMARVSAEYNRIGRKVDKEGNAIVTGFRPRATEEVDE